MVITYYGKQFIKITKGDTTLAYNPISKESKHKVAKFGADIVLVSMHHPDFNGVEQVAHGSRKPFVADSPGEYEVSGINVKGVLTYTSYQKEKTINTVYIATVDGVRLCFLGSIENPDLSESVKEVLNGVDVLFVPVGPDSLSSEHAHKISTKLTPSIVIPVDYDEKSLKQFLKEESAEGIKGVEKLTIKKRDLDGRESDVVVLKAQ